MLFAYISVKQRKISLFLGTKRDLFFLSPHCLTRAAGTAGGKPVRRAAAATQLVTAAPSANTKTGRSTTTSAVRACRGCRGAAAAAAPWAPPLPRPPPAPRRLPARHPLTRRAPLRDPCLWRCRAASREGLAAAVPASLPARRRAVPAVPLAPRPQPPLRYWTPPHADVRPRPALHTDVTVPIALHKTKLKKLHRTLLPVLFLLLYVFFFCPKLLCSFFLTA